MATDTTRVEIFSPFPHKGWAYKRARGRLGAHRSSRGSLEAVPSVILWGDMSTLPIMRGKYLRLSAWDPKRPRCLSAVPRTPYRPKYCTIYKSVVRSDFGDLLCKERWTRNARSATVVITVEQKFSKTQFCTILICNICNVQYDTYLKYCIETLKEQIFKFLNHVF